MDNVEVSEENSDFWNELCGSNTAKYLGVTDSSPASLKIFDDWYFDYYPYLFNHIPFADLRGKDVLEIGLGYGTVAQKLAESGANYQGLDIARGPVEMVNHRLRQAGLSGEATQGSILKPPFDPESFDTIVAIGCLHHTGDLQLAIQQCRELLRPGGSLVFMVYYAYSYRRFVTSTKTTLKYMAKETFGYRGGVESSKAYERAMYDANGDGEAAPSTDWISIRSLRAFCKNFSKFDATLENINQEKPFEKTERAVLLSTPWPHICGLDVYATATK